MLLQRSIYTVPLLTLCKLYHHSLLLRWLHDYHWTQAVVSDGAHVPSVFECHSRISGWIHKLLLFIVDRTISRIYADKALHHFNSQWLYINRRTWAPCILGLPEIICPELTEVLLYNLNQEIIKPNFEFLGKWPVCKCMLFNIITEKFHSAHSLSGTLLPPVPSINWQWATQCVDLLLSSLRTQDMDQFVFRHNCRQYIDCLRL